MYLNAGAIHIASLHTYDWLRTTNSYHATIVAKCGCGMRCRCDHNIMLIMPILRYSFPRDNSKKAIGAEFNKWITAHY